MQYLQNLYGFVRLKNRRTSGLECIFIHPTNPHSCICFEKKVEPTFTDVVTWGKAFGATDSKPIFVFCQ